MRSSTMTVPSVLMSSASQPGTRRPAGRHAVHQGVASVLTVQHASRRRLANRKPPASTRNTGNVDRDYTIEPQELQQI